ncbi:MAG TPA: glycosyltransferase family A protein [Chloroflexota bacterium]
MTRDPIASIIVTNYNYGRFLDQAIESALEQTYPHVEVNVVDDGSTDDSWEIIAAYRDRVTAVSKENGGQSSALNAGFRVISGEIVCFLDADDVLLPSAMQRAVDLLCEEDVVKVHWPMWTIDAQGRKLGASSSTSLADGDLRETARRYGPLIGSSPPTSGNAWSRHFLDEVLPLPEVEKNFGVGGAAPDDYLSFLASLSGTIRKTHEPQAMYRLHTGSDYSAQNVQERVRRSVQFVDHICAAGIEYCRKRGIDADGDMWRRNSWFHKLFGAIEDIESCIPPGHVLVLADEAQWGTGDCLAGRRVLPFLERDGQYWGTPPDDATATQELERLRMERASFLVLGWPAFWWLECYLRFHRYLRSHFSCLLENERVVIFDLRAGGEGRCRQT